MKKLQFILFLFLLHIASIKAQSDHKIDSLYLLLSQTKIDSVRTDLHYNIAQEYFKQNADSAFLHTKLSHQYAEKCNYKRGLAKATSNYGRYYFMTQNLDSALIMANRCLELNKEIGDKSYIAQSYMSVGAVNVNRGDLDKGQLYYEKSIELYKELKNLRQLAKLYGNIVVICHHKGDTDKAIDYQNKTLEIALKLKDNELIGLSYHNAAFLYGSTSSYEKSYESELKAIEYRAKDNDLVGLWECYINIAQDLVNLKRYEECISYSHKAIALINKTTKDVNSLALANLNMGEAYTKLKEYSKAEKTYITALNNLKSTHHVREKVAVNIALGRIKTELKQWDSALKYLNIASDLIRDYEDLQINRDIVALKALAYKGKKHYRLAYEHLDEYYTLKDSILNKDNIEKVAKLEAKFEHDKELQIINVEKENEAKLHQEKLKSEKMISRLYLSLLVVVFLGLFFIYRLYLQKKKTDSQKEVLLKEIHHRVKNNLQIVSSLLDLQSNSIDDESTLVAINDGQTRMKAMALIHQNLYQNKHLESISFKDYLEQLVVQVSSGNQIEQEVEHSIEMEDVNFDIDTAVPLGLIVNELLTNAFKYAFTKQDIGQLSIKLEHNQDYYKLSIKDNGLGLPDDYNFEKSKSLGLKLVRRLSKQLYGKAEYTFDNGSVFTIFFKDTETRKEIS